MTFVSIRLVIILPETVSILLDIGERKLIILGKENYTYKLYGISGSDTSAGSNFFKFYKKVLLNLWISNIGSKTQKDDLGLTKKV